MDIANEDPEYQDLLEAVSSEHNFNQLDEEHTARKFKKVWKQLSIINLPNGHLVLYNKSRVVPPVQAVQQLLQELHLHHSSASSMVDTIKLTFYWPRYEADTYDYVRMCATCEETSC